MPRGNGTGPTGQGPGTGRGAGRGAGGGKGGGAGRGGGRGRKGGQAMGPSGNCVCPKCGKTVPHNAGTPCYDITCAACGNPMTRK